MPENNRDLHGNVPDESPIALLIIDMVSTFEFEDADALFAQTEPIVPKLAALRQRCKQANIPIVYVNDNYGKWQSDWHKLLERCRESERGAYVLEQLGPDDDDYFVLKPKQSGFFATTLDALLSHLQAHTLILTGVAGDICVLFTAHDAYMRDYYLVVPEDCVASNSAELTAQALEQMERVMKVDRQSSDQLDFAALAQQPQEE